MTETTPARAIAHFYDVDPHLTAELRRALEASGCSLSPDGERADIVFCSTQRLAIEAAKSKFARRPLIAVSRLPEVNDWLDALEAGAADYCAAPFEAVQMRWIVETHLRHGRIGHAAA
jgi:PleD family two-component response regulator